MANADFSQNKQTAPGGFDAGSYREKAKPEQAVTLTPRQQKLAALEAKLPAALSTRAAALALSVVVMLAAFFGFGSAKLRGKYNTARQWFTAGVAADNGYNLSEELTTRENTAANILTTASNTLGADSAEVLAAQTALNDFSACLQAVQNGGLCRPAAQPAQRSVRGGWCWCAEQQHRADHHRTERPVGIQLQRRADRCTDSRIHRQ